MKFHQVFETRETMFNTISNTKKRSRVFLMNFDVGLLLFLEASNFFNFSFLITKYTFLVTIDTKEGGLCCRLELFRQSFVFNQN